MMVARIADVEFSVSLPVAFLRAALVEVVDLLSLDQMKRSRKSRGAVLRVPFPLIEGWFSFCILRLLVCMDAIPVFPSVSITRLWQVDWSAIWEQSWFSDECDDVILIFLKVAPPLTRGLLDGTEQWRDVGDEICRIYFKNY